MLVSETDQINQSRKNQMITTIGIVTLYAVFCPAYAALGFSLGKNWKYLKAGK